MNTSFTIEQTNSGFKVRAVTTKPNGKTTTRVVGRASDYEDAQVLIDDYEVRLGRLQPV